jgi:hypothetical protein
MLTFILSGLWHGASWNFLLWGGINGFAVLPASLMRRNKRAIKTQEGLRSSLKKVSKILLTFLFISLTWVFFRAPDLSTAFLILKKIFTEALNLSAYYSIADLLHPYADYPLAGRRLIVFLCGFVVLEWIHKNRWLNLDAWPKIIRWLAYNALIFLILYFGTYLINQFYYYQF